MTRIHALITGVVQGVGFRYALREAACDAGATGWVRNRADGRVEAEVEGTPEAVARVREWMRHGPAGARVDDVDVTAVAAVGSTDFEIRGTAR